MCVFVQVCVCDSAVHGSFPWQFCLPFAGPQCEHSLPRASPSSPGVFLDTGTRSLWIWGGQMRKTQVRICWLRALHALPTCCWLADLPLTDLLHSVLQLISLEEDDEDRLVHLVTLWERQTVRMKVMHAIHLSKLFGYRQHKPWLGPPGDPQCLPASETHFLCKLSTASSRTWGYVLGQWLQLQIYQRQSNQILSKLFNIQIKK